MIITIILIAAVSLDAFSFGLAQGFKKNKLTLLNILIMTILSTILFSIPLHLSNLVFKYFDKNFCNLFNGIILILLGLIYFISSFMAKNCKNEKEDVKFNTLCIKNCILFTFPINLDAVFTAFLNGYNIPNLPFAILIFFVFTFCSLLIPNKISLKLSNKSSSNLSWLSGLIFIIIGSLKSFGI